MFLVEDQLGGMKNLVFTWSDPRRAGYEGRVVEDVSLDYDLEGVHDWPDGEERPSECVGRSPDDPKHYQVFRNSMALRSAGFEPIDGNFTVLRSWKDYLKLSHPEELPDEDWFQELDRLDDAARVRRNRSEPPDGPVDKSRDAVAAWVAKTHLLVDSGIREVWYLPQQSPPEEIRLLEISDRLAFIEDKPAAIDFGLDIEGAQFRLLVADVTSEQLDQIQRDPSYLPAGWVLGETKVWRRGA